MYSSVSLSLSVSFALLLFARRDNGLYPCDVCVYARSSNCGANEDSRKFSLSWVLLRLFQGHTDGSLHLHRTALGLGIVDL